MKFSLDSRKNSGCVKVLLSLILCNTTLFITAINATHFRGGTIWWKPSPDYDKDLRREILVEYNIGWRISFSSDVLCNDQMIINQNVTETDEVWATASEEISTVNFICKEYDSAFDWMIGYNRFYYNLTDTANVTLWNEGRCWVSNLYYSGCEWSLSMFADVGERSDIGIPNSSPKTSSAPVMRMQLGCPLTVQIPTTDPDGDVIKCRFGENFRECGDVCVHFPYFSISEDCVLSYNGGGLESLVTVAIIIEDYPQSAIKMDDGTKVVDVGPNEPMSYVPLQFLVMLESSDNPCNAKPTFTDGTPPDGQRISTLTGAEFSFNVYTTPSLPSENITEVTFQYPFGSLKSVLQELDDDIYHINMSWVPTFEQLGSNIICFTAKDSAGLASEQRCVTVYVGGTSSPCEVNNGGCSDVCRTLSDSSYICNCPNPCWFLDTDGRTCRPLLTLECESDAMIVSLPACAVDNPLVTLGSTSVTSSSIPEECRVERQEDVYNFTMDFTQCQMRVQETFWELKYWNVIRLFSHGGVDSETHDDNSPITRGAWYIVPISCTFSKFGNLTASFKPIDRKVELLDVPGMGEFSFFLDFYNSSSFDQAIGPYDYPLSFTVNNEIYFGIRAVGGGINLRVFTISCVAFPGENEDTTYEMISDGCLRDSTLREYEADSPMENHFSITAFKFRENFPSDDGPTVVNIQCSVMVCQAGDEITRCSQGCTSPLRQKRDVDDISRSSSRTRRQLSDDDDEPNPVQSNITETPEQVVSSSGNIQIVVEVENNPPDPPNDNGNEEVSNTDAVIIVAAAVGGISFLLLVVICTIIIYHNKVVRTRNLILPDTPSGNKTAAYVRDIYLPNVDLDRLHPPYTMAQNPPGEFVWASRVISKGHQMT